MAARHSGNESSREIFTFLSLEEKKHYNFFLDHYKSLEGNKKLGHKEALQELLSGSGNIEEVFTKDYLKRLAGDNYALSTVSIGIQLEKTSIDFYKKHLESSDSQELRTFLEFLIGVEIKHHELLTAMEKEMIEQSWHENRFSPF
jgi:hypothetical protein